ncbi:MAG: inositol monophosphatase [Actinomycetia bacterium]|nr:inositol monophosphatase [Actinomycetes bacterium]
MDDAELAAELVRDAGRLAERLRRAGVEVARKTSVTDVVTSADRAAEELIAARLAAARPGDGLVGEEGAARVGGPGARVWYADPVDGTYNFSCGLPIWCSALALAAGTGYPDEGPGSTPLLGAVYQAPTDELWLGGMAQPTTRNGEPVGPIVDRPLSEVSLATYLHPQTLPDESVREPLMRAMRAAATVRMLGSGSIELAAVAAGRLGASAQYDSLPWDWLPGAALVRAAGGVAMVVRAHGRRWHIAGCARVADQLAALVTG